MIEELAVTNLGVIESARLEPGQGLTVISGETGTGKTLLLGALRLLIGGNARSELVGPFGDEAVAEGRFLDRNGEEVGAARRLPRNGRSRAYLDASIASAAALDERIAGLVEVVGQHDQLGLTRAAEVRALVDSQLDADGHRALESYRAAWNARSRALADRETLGGDVAALNRELDLVTFQAEEIRAGAVDPDEAEELERAGARLGNADEIVHLLAEAFDELDISREALSQAIGGVRRAARLDPSLDIYDRQLGGLADQLVDLAASLRQEMDGTESDPARLEQIEARLTALGDLRRKYGKSLVDVVAFGQRAAGRRDELAGLLERADAIDGEVEQAEGQLARSGQLLSDSRRRAGEKLAKGAVTHLKDLGFSDPTIEVSVGDADPTFAGSDRVVLEFASDSRLRPGPVSAVASGGELSRLVLALRLAGETSEAATLVFDEVDAGIGGATALALARKLAALAQTRQVMCVTHLPQIAAFADRHYVVSREGATAGVGLVIGEARVAELARMLAGLPESDRGREAAEELLEMAGQG